MIDTFIIPRRSGRVCPRGAEIVWFVACTLKHVCRDKSYRFRVLHFGRTTIQEKATLSVPQVTNLAALET